MATIENTWNVSNRMHSNKDSDNPEVNHIIAGADEIYDDSQGRKQNEVNTDVARHESEINDPTDGLQKRVEDIEAMSQIGDTPVETNAGNIISDTSLSGKVASASAVNGVYNALDAQTGYYTCGTAEGEAAKTVDAPGFVLSRGGSIKIKMTNANSANNATLNINSTGAKALYYDGERAGGSNTWEAGETIEVYYDGTSYYANNVAGGSSSGVFDVSKKFPTSGVEGGDTYTLELALSVLNANLSANKKEGGMEIKFVSSSDHKYVQYRYMGTDITGNPNPFLNTENWALSGDGYKTGLINVTLEYPLSSGQFYQISDATAANYAPAAIPVYRRVQGCILKIEVSSLNYQLFKFNGAANVSASWLAANRWVRILDVNDKNEVVNKINSVVYNLTEEVPLSAGQYYQITDNSAANFAPSAIPTALKKHGFLLLFQNSANSWVLYKFVRDDIFYWNMAWAWKKQLDENDYVNLVAQEFIHNIFKYENNASNNQDIIISVPNLTAANSFILGILLNYPIYRAIPKIRINTGSLFDIYKKDGSGINLTDMRRTDKVYFISCNNTSFTLLNPDNDDDINLSNVIEKGIKDSLEIGYIGSTNCQDGSLNTRLRTKAGILYKTPLKLSITDGYVLNGEVKVDIENNTSEYVSRSNTGNIYYPEDKYLRRFVFRKADDSPFTNVENAASVIIGSSSVSAQETLSLSSCENMLLIGTSHTEGNGSLKDKSMASYLSALSDWNVLNLGYSGSNYIKHFYYLLNDTELTGSKWSDVVTGGICLDFLCGGAENVYAQTPMDGKYSAENMKRLYDLIKSKGFDIVAGSYWGDDALSISDIQKKVAKELGLDTFDINNDLYRINDKEFLPYWYNAHFATRTVANQFFTLMQRYRLRRPRKAIKVYRNRVTGASNDSLLYNNAFERLEKWRELSVGHRAIADGKENYVDRLDLYIEDYLLSTVASEYTSLRKKEAISFSDKALIEFILPVTAYNVHDLKLYISTSAINANVYIRKYQDASLVIPISPASAVFIISGDASGISDGDVFTDTLNSGVTFTVTNVDVQTSRIMCTASGSFVTPGQTTDTLTRASDSQEFTATSLTSGVPAGYLDEAASAHGKWEAITKTEDSYVIANPNLYMEYDKISILIDNNGSSFTIDDIYATYVKGLEKSVEQTVVEQYPVVSGTSILEDKFVNSVGVLDDTHGSYTWDGNENYVNGSGVTVTKNHIPPYYNSKGATRVLHLKQGDKISYDINGFTAQTQADGVHDYRLTIVCRYFPASNLDVNATTFTITPNTFDFSKLGIKYNVGWSAVFTDERYVPASFVELHKDIHFDGIHTGNSLELIAVEDDVEILYVKMEKIS